MGSRLTAVLSAAMIISILALGSCSTTVPSPSQLSPASIKPYGDLTVAVDFGTIGGLDPQVDSTISMTGPTSAYLDSLIFQNPDTALKPGIAERWEISPDGMTHTFYIRKGVKFHNGDNLTAADVKFSIERMMAPESITPEAPAWRSAVASVEVKDDYTAVVHLKDPLFDLLRGSELAMGAVMPKKYFEEKGVDYFRKNPVGSGPWKVVKYTTEGRLELEAVENHWRKVPKFKNITILNVPDMATRVAMLKTGELDLAVVDPDSVPTLKSAGLRIFSYDAGIQVSTWIFYDMAHPEQYALGEVRVRKALQLAANRKEIADKILEGFGGEYPLYAVTTGAYFFDPNVLKLDPYDPEGAKKLLAEAGYSNGFKTRIYDRTGGGVLNTINLALSGYWKKIGINAEMVPVQVSTMFSMYSPKQKPEIWNSVYPFNGSPPIDFTKMSVSYHSTKSSAKTTKNLKLDELIERVPQTADPAEKKRLALEAALLAKNEYTALAIVSLHTILAFGPKIGEMEGFQANVLRGLMFETITHAR